MTGAEATRAARHFFGAPRHSTAGYRTRARPRRRLRRETYVGPYLPEPVLTDGFDAPSESVPERRQAFFHALATGDLQALATLLAEQATLQTDHGGKASAARARRRRERDAQSRQAAAHRARTRCG